MGKEVIIYKCGHEETKEINGSYETIRKKIVWERQNRICHACYKDSIPKRAIYAVVSKITSDGQDFLQFRIYNSFSIKDRLRLNGYHYDTNENTWWKRLDAERELIELSWLEKAGVKITTEAPEKTEINQ